MHACLRVKPLTATLPPPAPLGHNLTDLKTSRSIRRQLLWYALTAVWTVLLISDEDANTRRLLFQSLERIWWPSPTPPTPPTPTRPPPTRSLSNRHFNWLIQITHLRKHPQVDPPAASSLTVRLSVQDSDPLLVSLPTANPPPPPIHSHLPSVSVSVIRTFSSHTHSLLTHFNFSPGRPLIIFTLEFTASPLVRVSPWLVTLAVDRLIIQCDSAAVRPRHANARVHGRNYFRGDFPFMFKREQEVRFPKLGSISSCTLFEH